MRFQSQLKPFLFVGPMEEAEGCLSTLNEQSDPHRATGVHHAQLNIIEKHAQFSSLVAVLVNHNEALGSHDIFR